MPWFLRRSPLAPGVPLEGSDTVQGLRTLERLRRAELLPDVGEARGGGGGGGGGNGGWQRAYQRYRGPYLEQLTSADLQAAPKGWALFWRGGERGRAADAYSLPATLAVLRERAEENLVAFLPNYLRLAAGVLLACFYLRPRALLGGACLAYSVYRSIAITMRRQLAEAEAQAAVAAAGGGAAGRQAAAAARQRAAAAGDPNEQAVTALLTAVTWVAVAYTRCLPVVALGCCAAALAVGAHAALRRAASEQRYKGRVPLAFSWRQVLGQEPVPPGADPRGLLWEAAAEARQAVARAAGQLRRYCRFYAYTALDSLASLFRRRP